jgi:hypothetical protein
MQALIELNGLGSLRLQPLDLIANLDALEMLPGIKQEASCQGRPSSEASPEIAQPRRRRWPQKSRIIDALDGVKFCHA